MNYEVRVYRDEKTKRYGPVLGYTWGEEFHELMRGEATESHRSAASSDASFLLDDLKGWGKSAYDRDQERRQRRFGGKRYDRVWVDECPDLDFWRYVAPFAFEHTPPPFGGKRIALQGLSSKAAAGGPGPWRSAPARELEMVDPDEPRAGLGSAVHSDGICFISSEVLPNGDVRVAWPKYRVATASYGWYLTLDGKQVATGDTKDDHVDFALKAPGLYRFFVHAYWTDNVPVLHGTRFACMVFRMKAR